MNELWISRTRLLFVAAMGALVVTAMLGLAAADSARANGEFDFCYGKTLAGNTKCSASPSAGYIQAVYGVGNDHSVCVGVDSVGVKMCSSGPGKAVLNESFGKGFGFPYIENNAAGSNKVYGHAWWVDPPPPPPAPKYRYMLGTSNGSSIGAWSYALSEMSFPYEVAVGDITGDGKDDAVFVEKEGGGKFQYVLAPSNGSGFGGLIFPLHGMSQPVDMAVGDVTGDGKDDIVTVEEEGGGKYRYMLGTGASGGLSGWGYLLTGMSKPAEFGLGDVNGDGKDDVVALEEEGGGKYRYMFGISGGTSISSWGYALTGLSPQTAMGVGDVTGDGKADVASVESEGGGKYRYMLGTSNGSNISSWNWTLTGMSDPVHMELGDVNGDGKADIVAAEESGLNSNRYMFGISTGSGFNWGYALTGLSWQSYMGVGDVTGDGKDDVVGVEAY